MIETAQGDILKSSAEALVNTVNCVGVMGRGVALQFKKAFPDNFKAYGAACKANEVRPGKMFVHELSSLGHPRLIINFPTKRHWREKSLISDISLGLEDLVNVLKGYQIRSISIPPLGCGLGGLNWLEVRPLIVEAFNPLPEVRVLLFEPSKAPAAVLMVKVNRIPKMTIGRAALLGLMRRYLLAVMDPTVTLLEVHKLMYFMQEAGEPLRLKFQKAPYGPYAENLRHVITHIEGHFLIGYGDAEDRPDRSLELIHDAVQQSDRFLEEYEETRQRFDRVANLIQGFETSFGMELLSSVHWVATREAAQTDQEAIALIHGWNARKRMFKPHHIQMAWERLDVAGWLPVLRYS